MNKTFPKYLRNLVIAKLIMRNKTRTQVSNEEWMGIVKFNED